MSLDQLTAGLVDGVDSELEVAGLCLDSRQLCPGEVFVALPGAGRHGLEFADQAVARGCAAVLWEPPAPVDPPVDAGVPYFRVPGLRACLGDLAGRLFGHPSRRMTVIGVTGTNGKTSCVHLLTQALAASGQACGSIGTLGIGPAGALRPASHTTPDVITVHRELAALREEGLEAVAMEVSSHALDQGRVDGVEFAAAVFTNLTRDHLDYHRTMQRYAAAKARLFAVPGLRFAILNADDPAHESLVRGLDASVRRIDYGIGAGDVRAAELRTLPRGVAFELRLDGESHPVRARLLGRFNVLNLLAVAAVLHALGWPGDHIAATLEELEPVPGRMNLLGGGDRPLVVVDYAHTPDALEKSLGVLREHVRGRLIVVFGCGGERDAGKRPQMGAAAARLADRVILTDDNPRGEDGDRIVADILAGIAAPEPVTVLRDRAEAIRRAIVEADRDDGVLVAGKGHEDYQEIHGERRPFDDRTVASRVLEAAA